MRKIIDCLIWVKVVLRLLLPLILLFTPIMIVSNSQPVSDKVVQRSQNTLEIKPPSYHTDSNNVYTLSAVAYDSKGNASNRAVTQLTVTAPHVRVNHSPPVIFDAQNSTSKDRITADGKDEADTTLSAVTEHNGLYIATLTRILTKRVTITPHIDGKAVERVAAKTVTFTAARVDFDESSFSSSSGILFTDGQDKVTLAFTAIDGGNQPLHGLAVSFKRDDEEGTILSPIIEKNGIYSATLKGFSAKKVTIEPRIGGQAVAGITEKTVTLSRE